MTDGFTLNRAPAARSGPGETAALTALLNAAPADAPALLVFDPALAAVGVVETVEAAARAGGRPISSTILPPGEPKEAFVRAAVSDARAARPAAVVCVGGGSAIDAGKLIACLLDAEDDVARYRLNAAPIPPRRAALICLPTTAGTGAEATTTAILADDSGVKHWFWADGLAPDAVILDPALTTGLPPGPTAATGFDALVHALEAATNARATAPNSVYALHAVRLVRDYLPSAVAAPTDLIARGRMQEAAFFAGLAINNAGTGVAHAIGHALGSLTGMPHGRAVALGLCASLDWSIDGFESAFLGVADAFEVAEVRDLPGALSAFAEDVELDMAIGAAGAALTVETLARQIAQEENAAMLAASRRPVAEDDLAALARKTLTLGRG